MGAKSMLYPQPILYVFFFFLIVLWETKIDFIFGPTWQEHIAIVLFNGEVI